MKKIEWLAKWGLIIVVGYLLQCRAIDTAFEERGYEACGGEYLVLPLVIVFAVIIEGVWREIKGVIDGRDAAEDS